MVGGGGGSLRSPDNKPILTRSTLAAGIVQDTIAGEAGEGEGDEWRLLLPLRLEILPLLSYKH